MIGVAVIGYGYWGPNLVRNLAEIPDARLVSVCDLRQERLASVLARYPTISITDDLAEVLRDPRVDAVAIANVCVRPVEPGIGRCKVFQSPACVNGGDAVCEFLIFEPLVGQDETKFVVSHNSRFWSS